MMVVHTKSIAEFVLEVQTMVDEQDNKLRTLAQAVLEAHKDSLLEFYCADADAFCQCLACTIAREVLK